MVLRGRGRKRRHFHHKIDQLHISDRFRRHSIFLFYFLIYFRFFFSSSLPSLLSSSLPLFLLSSFLSSSFLSSSYSLPAPCWKTTTNTTNNYYRPPPTKLENGLLVSFSEIIPPYWLQLIYLIFQCKKGAEESKSSQSSQIQASKRPRSRSQPQKVEGREKIPYSSYSVTPKDTSVSVLSPSSPPVG